MARFCRFELRTVDVPAARAFYAAVLGEPPPHVVPLPAQAAARGAPPHWLGHLGVPDVEGAARALEERGAVRLGPKRATADGEVALLRDPGGAVVALASPDATPPRPEVAWHQLLGADPERTASSYAALFGWRFGDALLFGLHRPFAWSDGGPEVGSIADVTRMPGAHPHWLFHFRVAALDAALGAVRAAGGEVFGTTPLPDGGVAVCHDPQGAAFALRSFS